MWVGSAREAIREAQVDILKAKILKAWGPQMEQTADAVLETFGAVWASKIADVRAAEAKEALRGRVPDIMFSEKKK